MKHRIPPRTGYAGLLVGILGGLVLLLPSGSAGSPTAGACSPSAAAPTKSCLYDIELAAETRMPGIGVFGLTARFPRVSLAHGQNPFAPATPRSLSISLKGYNGRMTGTVVGSLDIRMPDCVHKRTYRATARAEFGASLRLGTRAGAGLHLDLAPPKEIPPQWAETCSSYREQNRDLASVMFAVGNQIVQLSGPGTTGNLSVGQDSFVGKASLAAVYGFKTKRPQASETSLDAPWRELWAGRSAVIRQRAVLPAPGGDRITNVRLSFTRR